MVKEIIADDSQFCYKKKYSKLTYQLAHECAHMKQPYSYCGGSMILGIVVVLLTKLSSYKNGIIIQLCGT